MSGRRTTAGARLRRLLAMIPWLAANDGPTVADVCARFAITEGELQQDLELLTTYVGVPPYGPERLFHVTIEGGRVFAHLTPAMDRPLRLSPDEAVALVVAGQALAEVPGAEAEGALARALAKVAGLLGVDPAEAVEIDLGTASAPTLGTLRGALAAQRPVEIEHVSASGERRTRTVDPWQVVNEGGAWYLVGHDHLRDEPRWFRLDRVVSARVLEGTARPAPTADVGRHAYEPSGDDPRVTLDLAPSARWVVETYPVEEVTAAPDGSLRARLAIGSAAFLASLLVRLGPDARVVDAPPGLAEAGREGARRTLARYR